MGDGSRSAVNRTAAAAVLRGAAVLQTIPRLDVGGAERTTLEVADALVEAGAHAHVATEGGVLQKEAEGLGAVLHAGPFSSKSPWTIWRNAARLTAIVKTSGAQILHARSRAPAWSALFAARRAGVPFVTTYHGVYEARSAMKRFYNGVMARGDVVIANSNFTRARILSEHRTDPSKIVVIPRGVDLKRFDEAAVTAERRAALASVWGIAPPASGDEEAPRQRIAVAVPGRLARWKGQHVAVRAAQLLRESGQQGRFQFMLVGGVKEPNAYAEELRVAIVAAGLGDMVKMVGHCADMPAALSLSDVVVSPSVRPEAFGRVAVEAQAMGRPVIAADHGGARETILQGETGWRTPPGDAEALAAVLSDFAKMDRARRARMGDAARRRAETLYSADEMCASTLRVYADLLTR
ncbi:MAG: glycosyltransferase family 4 protein [Pseudomonadota bacterium]